MPNPIILTRTYDDTDAIAYLAALTSAGITPSATQIQAAHFFAKACKWANIWTKFTAVYPFIGGTAATHAVNMKTPGTYNITWTSVTHNSNGITGNGSSAYGDTGISPRSAIADPTSCHISWYARTITNELKGDVGCYNSNSDVLLGYSNYTGYGASAQIANGAGGSHPLIAVPRAGMCIGSRTSSTVLKIRNANQVAANSTSAAGKTVPVANFYILSVNGLAQFSSKNLAFCSIGSGLSDTDATNLSSIVQSLQTILGRAV